jgi:uncharacterized protein
MEAIYIPQLLKMPGKTEEIHFNNPIEDLETLIPVKGILMVSHRGNFLEVQVKAETIVTLTCDRCLQSFNHRLKVETSELIWLENEFELEQNIPLEREISRENLAETLDPNGFFEVETWLYEQLSLALPMRQLCGKDCQTPAIKNNQEIIDPCWANLASLKSLIQD